MAQTNFLIGKGELLTHHIEILKGGGPKKLPYSISEARERIAPQAASTSQKLEELPPEACPQDIAVCKLALHPAFIAKSFFPAGILKSNDMQSLGSRNVTLTPSSWTKKGEPRPSTTTELFIAGTRKRFKELKDWLLNTPENEVGIKEVVRIERIEAFTSNDRLRSMDSDEQRIFEVGVHLLRNEDSKFIESAFRSYAKKLGIKIYEKFTFKAGSLWFVPIEADKTAVEQFAQFSFIRVVRSMPKLRGLQPTNRSSPILASCKLPNQMPISLEPKVAILDGGLPKQNPLKHQWLESYKISDQQAKDDQKGLEHGLAVTSAYLFGSLPVGGVAQRPYAPVNHVRVLDADTQTEDSLDLYRTLGHIEEVLLTRQYDFVNLSLGPDLPIEDEEVHAWTSVIDNLLSDGNTLMTIAAGNNGERDQELKYNRIQVPSDCVNAIAVGSASDTGNIWKRARYSAVDPGRRPGVVKPDVLAFGGDAAANKYFHALDPSDSPVLVPLEGTSFASPLLLRNAVGIRAILGEELSPLAIKCLLIHSAKQNGIDKNEVGWGKVPESLSDIITSPPGIARVLYQGELNPKKYLRAPIPIPTKGLSGNVRLKATFCYASPIDPQEASSYTRAGLDITFRPNDSLFNKDKKTGKTSAQPKSQPFFDKGKFATEEERRADWGKWETTLHAEKGFQGSKLKDPAFDIHYNARESGAASTSAEKIKYALVITVEAHKHQSLYNEILQNFASKLIPIQPKVSIPITT